MRYFLIAGEASGDLHASLLIAALKQQDSNAEFCFLGGDKMAEESGVLPKVHYSNMAYMGFVDVIINIRSILSIMGKAKQELKDFSPDALILIDYPSFNLKMAKYAKSLGIPVFYYISPKVWAWKEYRVKEIKKYVDGLYSILPFETEFYRKHDYTINYAGNPSVKEITEAIKTIPARNEFCEKYQLNVDKGIIAILPGSRRSEVKHNLPTMLNAANKFPNYQIVIGGAPCLDINFYESIGGKSLPKVIFDDTYSLVRNARVAIVTSGTATLETALLNTPQIACYSNGGGKIQYWLLSRLIKVKYVTLPNLIADKLIIPELLLHNCNVGNINRLLNQLLPDTIERKNMLEGYKIMRAKLGQNDCAEYTATSIMDYLKSK